MGSNIDIMIYFVKKMFNEKPTEEEKQLIINTINSLLAEGFSEKDIKLEIGRHKRKFGSEKNIEKIFSNKTPGDNKNLLKLGTFYYHSELRLAPGPPRARYDPETKEITKTCEPYYLEMKASYTMEELIEYYCKAMGLKVNENRKKRYKVVFENLLESYSLDEILFTIDAAADIRKKSNYLQPLTNPFGLTDYLLVGEENLALKVGLSKQEGVDQVVYRKREPIFNS